MNTKLLRKVQKHILQEPLRLNMDIWKLDNAHIISTHGLAVPACETVACIAGWATVLSDDIKKTPWDKVEARASKLLGLTTSQASLLFQETSWPENFFQELAGAQPQTPEYAQIASDRIDHFITTKGRE